MIERKMKILMADDEPDVLNLMAKRITQEGFEVISAQDGEEAWKRIVDQNPDIILLDLVMPKRDGFSILRELRENPPTEKWQPVIIVSAKTELADLKQGFDLDADHYLTKPCDIESILKAIRTMIRLIPQHKSVEELSQGEK